MHACTAAELVNWIDDELWFVELAGPIEERESVILARRGRLLRRVEGWNAVAAHAFAETYVMQARDAAVDALRRTGDREGALALAGVRDLEALGAHAVAEARRADGLAVGALAYVADGVELAHGGRPERYGFHPAASARPTPGAIAANLGFVVAHALGSARAEAEDDPAAYAAGFEAERVRQRAWLVERLGLDVG